MFTQTWKKYLSIITILLKRSVLAKQTLKMNYTDFARASAGRKIKFSFSNLQLNKGKINQDGKHTPVARELAEVLQEDNFISSFVSNKNFVFAMNNDFELTIDNVTQMELKETMVNAEDVL